MSKDSEISQLWRAVKLEKRKQRQCKFKRHHEILRESGLSYDNHNRGLHVIIHTSKGRIDCWPSTGKWRCKDKTRQGFRSMMAFIEKK